jgi:hypothetical protein
VAIKTCRLPHNISLNMERRGRCLLRSGSAEVLVGSSAGILLARERMGVQGSASTRGAGRAHIGPLWERARVRV